MPAGPGLSQGSPSRVRPCTAIATRPVTAVCSWIALSTRPAPGLRESLPAIVRPEDDRDRHQPERDHPGGAAGEPPDVLGQRLAHAPAPAVDGMARGDREASPADRAWRSPGRRARPRRVSSTSIPPRAASSSRARLGPLSSAALERVSASRACAPERGDADQAGPGRLAGAGVEQVVGEGAVVAAPDARVEPGAGDSAGGHVEDRRRLAVDRVAGVDLRSGSSWRRSRRPGRRRRSRPRSASSRARRSASMSAASPLPLPPVSKATPGGRRMVPASSSTSICRHSASARARRTALRGERQRIGEGNRLARRRGTARSPPRRSRRAGSDRPGRRSSPPPRGPARTARRSSGEAGTSRPRVLVERGQLAVGAEARERGVEAPR